MAAVHTGVVGSTGVESAELIQAWRGRSNQQWSSLWDALAACSAARLGKTIQIADTGIIPGSGVGNARAALNQETLGIPVIAMGVPTVVDAGTLVAELTGRERTGPGGAGADDGHAPGGGHLGGGYWPGDRVRHQSGFAGGAGAGGPRIASILSLQTVYKAVMILP